MAFCLVMGTHTFNNLLKGYEDITVQCQNCGNYSGKIYKRWQFFTLCWIPLIPFSIKPWHDVGCHICNHYQDIKYRPDVQQRMNEPGRPDAQQGQSQSQSAATGQNQGFQQGNQQYPMQAQKGAPGGPTEQARYA